MNDNEYIKIIWSSDFFGYDDVLKFSEHNNITNLKHKFYYNIYHSDIQNKYKRLLYISGLEYERINNVIENFNRFTIYLYTLADFDRYIRILTLSFLNSKLIYDREEVETFYG